MRQVMRTPAVMHPAIASTKKAVMKIGVDE
jgi:hypothetical protein